MNNRTKTSSKKRQFAPICGKIIKFTTTIKKFMRKCDTCFQFVDLPDYDDPPLRVCKTHLLISEACYKETYMAVFLTELSCFLCEIVLKRKNTGTILYKIMWIWNFTNVLCKCCVTNCYNNLLLIHVTYGWY